jgi:hypothetical protein
MKTSILFTAALFLLTAGCISAQDDMREKFVFGMKAGINRSDVYDQQGQAFIADAKTGFAGGAFVSIPFGRYFGFQPELMYSQKGYSTTNTVLGLDYSYTRTTGFMDIPLQLMFKPSKYFTLLAGPQFSYLLSTRDVYQNGPATTIQQQNTDNDNARKNILGATTGFDVTLGHFVIGGRASWDFQNNNGNGTSSYARYRNVWYQATLGLRL